MQRAPTGEWKERAAPRGGPECFGQSKGWAPRPSGATNQAVREGSTPRDPRGSRNPRPGGESLLRRGARQTRRRAKGLDVAHRTIEEATHRGRGAEVPHLRGDRSSTARRCRSSPRRPQDRSASSEASGSSDRRAPRRSGVMTIRGEKLKKTTRARTVACPVICHAQIVKANCVHRGTHTLFSCPLWGIVHVVERDCE